MKKLLVLLFVLNTTFVYAEDGFENLSEYFEKDNNTIYDVWVNGNVIEIKSDKNDNILLVKADDAISFNQFVFEIIKVGTISKWGKDNVNISNIYLGYGNINLNTKEKIEKLTGTLNNQTLLITGEKSKETISIPIIDLDVFRDLYVTTVIASSLADGVSEMKKSFDNATKEFEKNMNKAIDELNK